MAKRYLFEALSGATVGIGPALALNEPARVKLSWQVITTGSPTDIAGNVQFTMNGTDFSPGFNFSGLDFRGGLEDSYMVKGLRVNLTGISGGSSPTITMLMAVEEAD